MGSVVSMGFGPWASRTASMGYLFSTPVVDTDHPAFLTMMMCNV